jgi:DNA-binding response OmpR family regulator
MIVDDEPDITTILSSGLKRYGFEVDSYNAPFEALAQFKPNYYTAIILDIRMPGMNGFELARKIWAADPSAKICFFSAFEILETEAKSVFVNHKSHCFIKKPIMPSELSKHIETHLIRTI